MGPRLHLPRLGQRRNQQIQPFLGVQRPEKDYQPPIPQMRLLLEEPLGQCSSRHGWRLVGPERNHEARRQPVDRALRQPPLLGMGVDHAVGSS